LEIDVKDEVGLSHSVSFSDPDSCPVCHLSIRPMYVTSVLRESVLQVVYECPSYACRSLFLATFEEALVRSGRIYFDIEMLFPITAGEIDVPDQIRKLSPSYVKIMEQTAFAEELKLDELVGIGMRKALEFLLKDYIGHKEPDADEIRSLPLASCIHKYIDDPRVKSCAQRAAWLGNDETHYVRRWDDKDVRDLKTLIRLTQNWIDNDLEYERYLAEMPNGK